VNAALGNYVNDNPLNLGNSMNADNQPSDQQALNTPNTACKCKHPRRFVSIDKVNTF